MRMKAIEKSFCLLWLVLLMSIAPAAEPASESDLRGRVRGFNQALLKGKYEEAAKLVDPDIVKAAGGERLAELFGKVLGDARNLNAAFGRKFMGVRIRRIQIGQDKSTAAVSVTYSTGQSASGGNLHEIAGEQKWVFKNMGWFFQK